MAVKVAINGFGRIGRLAFRQMFGHEGSEIVAINDLTSPEMLAYLLKYDSTQGNYSRDHEVTAGEDSITVDGKTIKIYKEADANNLPWGELGVDVVLECTGFYTSKDKAQAHINAGAKKVIVVATHGILSDPAAKRLSESGAAEVVVTDTLPIPAEKRFEQLTVLSIAPLLARAIQEVFEDGSVTSLFN